MPVNRIEGVVRDLKLVLMMRGCEYLIQRLYDIQEQEMQTEEDAEDETMMKEWECID